MNSGPPAGLDRTQLEELYVQLEKPLYNVVFRWLWSAEESHEIVQEAFVRLWQMRAAVRPESVRGLAYQIAINLARKRRRWLKIRTFLGLSDHEAEKGLHADDAIAEIERAHAVRGALESLPSGQREVIVLCHFSELSYREISEILGIPEGTVGSRRTLALRALRAMLGEVGHERAV